MRNEAGNTNQGTGRGTNVWGKGQPPGAFGWRRLQVVAAFAALASFALPMLIERSLEPFLLAMAAPFVIGLLVMRPWPRVGAIWLGVSSLSVLLFSAPFLADALSHPEAPADFVPLSIFGVSMLVGAIAAIPSFRRGSGPDLAFPLARGIAVVAGASIPVGILLSVVAFTQVESDPAKPGDIRVVAQDLEFGPARIDADAGRMSVSMTNRDRTRHTFTIDELGVDLSVPPTSTQGVAFTAGPGTYRFYCYPHAPAMEGQLVVR